MCRRKMLEGPYRLLKDSFAPHPTCSVSRLTCVFAVTALPGESRVSGTGGSQREAAAGGDAHGQSGSHAQ